MSRPAALLLLLSFAPIGCTWGGADGPTILSVTPSEAANLSDVELVIAGRDFEPAVEPDFDRPGRSRADGGFEVALVSGASRIPLGQVKGRSSGELRGTLAAGAPPATYDVEVRDPRGRVATLPAAFRVYAVVTVTTAADEADPGATPAAPGGTGFSLREAVAWVNGQGSATHIELTGPMTISMMPPQTAMTLTAPGAAVVATGTVVLDFGGINQNCFALDAADQRLEGVTIRGCTAVLIAMNAGGQQVSGATLLATGTNYSPQAILAQSTSSTWSRIGPGNVIVGAWYGVYVKGSNYEIFGNRVDDNGVGILLRGGAARIWRNTITRQTTSGSNKGFGVALSSPGGRVEILQNTFHANGGNAVDGAAPAGLTVRNNLFTAGAGTAVSASGAPFVHDHNGYFGNAGGAGVATDSTDVLLDPLYVSAAGGDFHLQPSSPAIDRGIDAGLDVNGPAPGLFNGLAPDLGALESP